MSEKEDEVLTPEKNVYSKGYDYGVKIAAFMWLILKGLIIPLLFVFLPAIVYVVNGSFENAVITGIVLGLLFMAASD